MHHLPRLTLTLIGACVVVELAARSQFAVDLRPWLFISQWPAGLPEIAAGEVWRLLTPIFLHFGLPHLVINLAWLWALGEMTERVFGAAALALLVAVVGVFSNLCQFAAGGPAFGGMSGVLYGLLGFLWMQSRFNPAAGARLGNPIVVMMLAWLVLCWSGVLEIFGIRVANTAHATGLGAGLLLGFFSAKLGRRGA